MRYFASIKRGPPAGPRPTHRPEKPVGWVAEAERRYLEKLGVRQIRPKRPSGPMRSVAEIERMARATLHFASGRLH